MINSTFTRRCCAAAFGLAAFAAAPAFADTDTITPDILVTAGAEPLPTKEVTSSYTIITAQDIEAHQYRTIVDALKSVPGIYVVQQGGDGSATSVFTRGTNSNETLVLLNGQPISDPSSPNDAFNFAFLTLENVERIEVVRGPQSALYGSQAIGGVINIITKHGTSSPSGTVSIEAGTRGSLNTTLTSGGTVEKTNYFASISRLATNGSDITPSRYRAGAPEEKDGDEDINASLQIDGALNEFLHAYANADFGDTRDATDESFGGIASGAKTRQVFLSGALEGSFADGKWAPKLTTSYTQYRRNDVDYPDYLSSVDGVSNNLGNRVAVDFDNTYRFVDWNRAALGAEYTHEEFEANGHYIDPSYSYTQTTDTSASTSSYAIYGSDHFDLGERLSATVSGRYDMPNDFENQFTYSISSGYYLIETDTRFTASYGTAFKVPALYERYGFSTSTYFGSPSYYSGNPNLKPEKSRGWEAGVEQGLFDNLARTGVTYFTHRIENAVTLDAFGTTSVNSPPFSAYGFESFVEVNPFPDLRARLDYTYTLFDDDDLTKPILRRPRNLANATLGWKVDDSNDVGLNVQWVDNYTDVSNAPPYQTHAPAYTVVNLSGSHQLTPSLKLTARVNNLLNKQYEPADGFQAPGIEAFAGIAYTF